MNASDWRYKMNLESEDHPFELRRKAEMLLKKKPPASTVPPHEDVNNIIHDLQVHQVELEMQNDELRKAQESLASSQKRYFNLFNQAPVGYASVDEQGIIKRSNQAISDMLCVKPRKLWERPLSKYVYEKDRSLFLNRFKILSRKINRDSFEIRMNDASGKIIYTQLAIRAAEPHPENKNAPKDILIIVLDISEKKASEKALRENKDLLNSIVEDIPAMICRFDSHGVVSYANHEYAAFFNNRKNNCLGSDFFSVVPKSKRRHVKTQLSSIAPGNPLKTFEFHLPSASGETKWQRWMIRAIYDEQNNVRFYQSIGYDITEQLQIQKEKKEKEKLEGIVELSGAVCHELRQPLQVILGLTELVSIKMAENQILEKELDLLKKEIGRINMLLYQLDNITRYETKPYVGNSKIIDLNNTSDRRKSKRYKPEESLFVQLTGSNRINARLIDISNGGISFWGIGRDLDHLSNFSCDILGESGNSLIKCLPCLLIPDESLESDELNRIRNSKSHRARFISLNHDQVKQIEAFISGFHTPA